MGCGLADEHHEDHTETGRGPEGGIFTPPFLRQRDLPDGPRLRMNVYKEAWERCKRRMQVRAWLTVKLHYKTCTEYGEGNNQRAVQSIHAASPRCRPQCLYSGGTADSMYRAASNHHLRYDYLPLIVFSANSTSSGTDRSASSAVVSDVERVLNVRDTMGEHGNTSNDVYVSSLSSGDCTNVPSAMKALIGGFIRRDPEDIGEGNVRTRRYQGAAYT